MDINLPNEGMPRMPQLKSSWLLILLIVVAFSAAGSLFYQVGPDEVGVVQQFGRYVRTTPPGLRIKFPFNIETVRNIKVTHLFKEEFGYRTDTPGVRTLYSGRESYPGQGVMRMSRQIAGGDPFMEESLMLTGDLNMAIVEWIIQYKIHDPVKYAFRVRNPTETIRNMSEAVIRLVVGDHTINEVLTSGRVEIQSEAKKKLQELMDEYNAGIAIDNVILQDVTPPNEVKPSFNEVNEARQEKEKVINQAWEEYNRVIPKAKGQAEQVIREAEGYSLERINRSQGDAERFNLTLQAYKLAPIVTKRRLYLEMMEKVLPSVEDKIFIDEAQKGILPLLNLNKERGEGGKES